MPTIKQYRKKIGYNLKVYRHIALRLLNEVNEGRMTKKEFEKQLHSLQKQHGLR